MSLRYEVVPGTGLVARQGDNILWIDSAVDADTWAQLRRLLDVVPGTDPGGRDTWTIVDSLRVAWAAYPHLAIAALVVRDERAQGILRGPTMVRNLLGPAPATGFDQYSITVPFPITESVFVGHFQPFANSPALSAILDFQVGSVPGAGAWAHPSIMPAAVPAPAEFATPAMPSPQTDALPVGATPNLQPDDAGDGVAATPTAGTDLADPGLADVGLAGVGLAGVGLAGAASAGAAASSATATANDTNATSVAESFDAPAPDVTTVEAIDPVEEVSDGTEISTAAEGMLPAPADRESPADVSTSAELPVSADPEPALEHDLAAPYAAEEAEAESSAVDMALPVEEFDRVDLRDVPASEPVEEPQVTYIPEATAEPKQASTPGTRETLLFDDGSTFALDRDYVVGRRPQKDSRVQSGQAAALTVVDPDSVLSSAHALVSRRDERVYLQDLGSLNGTHVAPPGANDWTRLDQYEEVEIVPGTRLLFGWTIATYTGSRA